MTNMGWWGETKQALKRYGIPGAVTAIGTEWCITNVLLSGPMLYSSNRAQGFLATGDVHSIQWFEVFYLTEVTLGTLCLLLGGGVLLSRIRSRKAPSLIQ